MEHTRLFSSFLFSFNFFFLTFASNIRGNGTLSTAAVMRFSLERRDRPSEDRARRCIVPTTSSHGNGIRSLACRGSEIQLVSCAEVSCGYREIREGLSSPPLFSHSLSLSLSISRRSKIEEREGKQREQARMITCRNLS